MLRSGGWSCRKIVMSTTTYPNDIDVSDRYDLDREWETSNYDYTEDLPPIPGTVPCTTARPFDCPCLACQADREQAEWMGCECEIDWRCPACGPGYTALELQNDEWAKSENAPWWAQ